MSATKVNINGIDELDLNLAGTVTATTLDGVTTINQTGVASVNIETNGTPNGSQTTLNLANGTGISITDGGTGTVTIKDVSAGGIGASIYGSSVPNTGLLGFVQIPFNCTINSWTILMNVSGSAQFDVQKSTFAGFPTTTSIVASAPPVVTAAQSATNSTLGWTTTTVTAGDVIAIYLTSVSTATIIAMDLKVTRT
jgi:hypothetical protein